MDDERLKNPPGSSYQAALNNCRRREDLQRAAALDLARGAPRARSVLATKEPRRHPSQAQPGGWWQVYWHEMHVLPQAQPFRQILQQERASAGGGVEAWRARAVESPVSRHVRRTVLGSALAAPMAATNWSRTRRSGTASSCASSIDNGKQFVACLGRSRGRWGSASSARGSSRRALRASTAAMQQHGSCTKIRGGQSVCDLRAVETPGIWAIWFVRTTTTAPKAPGRCRSPR